MRSLLEVRHLSKQFGNQQVLNDITFDIQAGDIVGLIGKNGCGKTTLMKMILGFTPATTGEISFEGDSNYISNQKRLTKIGFLLDCKLFEDFSAYENLKLVSMYSSTLHQEHLDSHINALLSFVGLENNTKPVKSYSFGMKQRLGLALALLDDPEFLILDEPFVGLDPTGVQVLLDYIMKLRQEKGVTVLISSHQLHEIEEICDYFLLIHDKTVEPHTRLGERQISLTVKHLNPELKKELSRITTMTENQVSFPYDMTLLNRVLRTIYKYQGEVEDIVIDDSLDRLFREVEQ